MHSTTAARRSLSYIRLAAFLAGLPAHLHELELSRQEVEELVGRALPADARTPSWWRNDIRRMHSRAWLTAGWEATPPGASDRIRFRRVP